MNAAETLCDSLRENAKIEKIEAGLYTVIGGQETNDVYDKSARYYDLLVGNSLYNRLIWGVWPSAYLENCNQALSHPASGPILDMGCGSLVFTCEAYLRNHSRPIILLDRSLAMLKRAKDRLTDAKGKIPDHIVLVQGDATNLPFRKDYFETVLSWGTLHVFEDQDDIFNNIKAVLQPSGHLYLSSLTTDRPFGSRYLNLLARAGEVGSLNSSAQLLENIMKNSFQSKLTVMGNMAFYTAILNE